MLGLAVLAGCGGPTAVTFVAPTLPADLQSLVANPDAFLQPDTVPPDPAARAVAQIPDISGCWARTSQPADVRVSPTGSAADAVSLHARLYEVWHFDATANTVDYELMIKDENSDISLLQVLTGTYAISSAGEVSVQFSESQANDWTTGQMVVVAPPTGGWPSTTIPMQINGDLLYFSQNPSDTNGATPETWVFQRFTCPS